jgi:hypothetical protein
MRGWYVLAWMVLLPILDTTYGRVLREEDECPLNGICVPDCPTDDPDSSVFFPHPSECQFYFECRDGVTYCRKCPSDLHWNKDLEKCDYPCVAGCITTPTTTTTTEETTTTEPTTTTTEKTTTTEETTTTEKTTGKVADMKRYDVIY